MLEEVVECHPPPVAGRATRVTGEYIINVWKMPGFTPPEPFPTLLWRRQSGRAAPKQPATWAMSFISTSPKAELVQKFQEAGGENENLPRPLTVCWAEDEAEARRTVHQIWPITLCLTGELTQNCARPGPLWNKRVKMVKEEVTSSRK